MDNITIILIVGGALVAVGFIGNIIGGWKLNRRFNKRLKAMKDQF